MRGDVGASGAVAAPGLAGSCAARQFLAEPMHSTRGALLI